MKAFLQFLQRAFKYFRNTKRVWRRPPRASLLIIDRGTASPLDEMFAHHKPHIMEIRGESVNMLALFRALPKIHLGAVAYLEAYIDFVKPKLILSRNGDSNIHLWSLKRRNRSRYKIALVQNGWRPDNFGAIPVSKFEKNCTKIRPSVDCAMIFGSAQADDQLAKYASLLIAVGSSKLNMIDFDLYPKTRMSIVFISEYRHQEFVKNPDFYQVDAIVCKYLRDFAIKNSIKIHVAGVMPDHDRIKAEKKWFAEQLSGSNWQFYEWSKPESSYLLMNNADLVVTIDSTMGYESLALGKKTAILCCRRFQRSEGRESLFDLMSEKISSIRDLQDFENGINNRFCASFRFAETGFFWTNIESPDEFERVLHNVFQASTAEFERISRPIRDQLMVHDYGNTKIRAYVEGVLTDSLESK
jgi:surface carbohydrate biosynthesis protein